MAGKTDIRSLSPEELLSWCAERDVPSFRARQLMEWLWKHREVDFEKMKNLPTDLRLKLMEEFDVPTLSLHEVLQSRDGTRKVVFRLQDGLFIEGVLIPATDRSTACISTQAGCPLACTFCATGHGGFRRNLSAAEIYDQFALLNDLSLEVFSRNLSNVVYMGMGEPLLNYEQSLRSIDLLADAQYGFGLSPTRITLSTVGLADGIRRLATEKSAFHLAISLHSARQEIRERLMPIAVKWPLVEVSDALKYYHQTTNRRITIEYLLLDGINDKEEDAKALANFCKSFPVKVNLIEYNNFAGSSFRKSPAETSRWWLEFLKSRNMVVNLRKSKGGDIAAACGQLLKENPRNEYKQ